MVTLMAWHRALLSLEDRLLPLSRLDVEVELTILFHFKNAPLDFKPAVAMYFYPFRIISFYSLTTLVLDRGGHGCVTWAQWMPTTKDTETEC